MAAEKMTPYAAASPALSCRFGREMRFAGFRFHQAPRQGTSVEEVKNLLLAAGFANAGMLANATATELIKPKSMIKNELGSPPHVSRNAESFV
jgi:hypothetical protein